jgi:acetyltransferase-like isoleucine patch superfamily enzyme
MLTLFRKAIFKIYSLLNLVILKINGINKPYPIIRGILILINKGGEIKFGSDCIINSNKYKNIIGGDTRSSIVIEKNAKIIIGNNFRLSNSAICCSNKITFGDNVMIGGGCKIWDSDFHPINSNQRNLTPNANYLSKEIKIGKNVFIGGCSIILKGVIIGDNTIIGAGSVVSKSIPANEIWAGNPAIFIKKNKVD